MPAARGPVEVSLTETPQFRRLARFLWDVEAAVKRGAHGEMAELVRDCKRDLLSMTIGDRED